MKIKTSITLDQDVLQAIDRKAGQYGSRSCFLETAARTLLRQMDKEANAQRDLDILNSKADELNAEAEDVMSFQEFS